MPSISEESHEGLVGRDDVDGFSLDVPKVDVYLKKPYSVSRS